MTTAEIIFNHFTNELDRARIKPSDGEPYPVDPEKFNGCVAETNEMLDFHLKNKGVCSSLLIHQLARHRCQLGEIIGDSLEFYRASDICHLIEAIELDKTDGDAFKYKPLKNLYKIHHGAWSGLGYSLMLNIKNYWFSQDGKIKKNKTQNYRNILAGIGPDKIGQIASKMHDEAIYSKKLTGEWLIYAKHGGKKYYLCLATHNEGDQNIFDNKILRCYQEYPELMPLAVQ